MRHRSTTTWLCLVCMLGALALSPPAVALTTATGFSYPLDSASSGSGFGVVGWGGGGSWWHCGTDISGGLAVGTPVYAVAAGRVVTHWGDGEGNYAIAIRHRCSDGHYFIAVYGHMQTRAADGADVAQGQQVGTLGPHSSGTHLHFLIYDSANGNGDLFYVGGSNGWQRRTLPRPAEEMIGGVRSFARFFDPIRYLQHQSPWGSGGHWEGFLLLPEANGVVSGNAVAVSGAVWHTSGSPMVAVELYANDRFIGYANTGEQRAGLGNVGFSYSWDSRLWSGEIVTLRATAVRYGTGERFDLIQEGVKVNAPSVQWDGTLDGPPSPVSVPYAATLDITGYVRDSAGLPVIAVELYANGNFIGLARYGQRRTGLGATGFSYRWDPRVWYGQTVHLVAEAVRYGTGERTQFTREVQIQAPPVDWQGALSAPADGQTVSGTDVIIEGWVQDASGLPVIAVEAYVNDKFIGYANYGETREGHGNTGFSLNWDSSAWSGEQVVVRASAVRYGTGERYDALAHTVLVSGPPKVMAVTPEGTEVPGNTNITVAFSENMNRAAVQGAMRFNGAAITSVPGVLSWTGNKLTFNPNRRLAPDTEYRIRIGVGAKSKAGVPLAKAFTWSFRTRPAAAPVLSVTAAPAIPAGPTVAFPLSISADASVGLEILSLAGRVIAVVPPRECAGGTTTLTWNGRSTLGTAAPAGAYLCRVNAYAADGSRATALSRFVLRR